MFKTMAATGKLVRVTELDLSLGTGSPSSNQYKAQSDCYRMIVESYKANVPEAAERYRHLELCQITSRAWFLAQG